MVLKAKGLFKGRRGQSPQDWGGEVSEAGEESRESGVLEAERRQCLQKDGVINLSNKRAENWLLELKIWRSLEVSPRSVSVGERKDKRRNRHRHGKCRQLF